MARKDLDSLLRHLGRPGRYQTMAFFLLTFLNVPLAFNNLAIIFVGNAPKSVSCRNQTLVPEVRNCTPSITFEFVKDVQSCSKYGSSSSEGDQRNDSEPHLCTDCDKMFGYDNVGEKTIVEEFDLICEDYWLVSLASTLYFVGLMIGGLVFGIASDRFGRKNSTIAGVVIALATGIGAAFAPNYTTFVISRFLLGFALQGVSLTAFTLMMESFGQRYRQTAGVAANCVFSIGIILLAGFAYLIQNWRYLQLFMTLLAVVGLAYIFVIHESLRWLYLTSRFEQADAVITKILKFNGLKRTKKLTDTVEYLQLWHMKDEEIDDDHAYSVWNLFTSSELRKRCLSMTFTWFAASLCYYVISFSLSEFFGSKYLNLAFGGFGDTLITVATVVVVSRFGCRLPLFYASVATGLLSIIGGAIPLQPEAAQIAKTVFSHIARTGSQSMFNVMISYTSDLLPTVVRNNGLGVCSIGMRLGGVLAPQLLLLGSKSAQEVPLVVCGIFVLVSAGLTYMLPETKGVALPETVDDLRLRRVSRSVDEGSSH